MMTFTQKVERADEMMRDAAKIATEIFSRCAKTGVDFRCDEIQDELNARWRPVYDRAVNYAAKHGISKHHLEYR